MSITRKNDAVRRGGEKPLHGQYVAKTGEIEGNSQFWLDKGWMKQTKGFLMAAQDHTQPTRN